MDFFTVPTVTFSLLYCFFVIGHDRRRILHINVTRQPTSAWIIQQLREAFPYQAGQRFLIFDRDSKYGLETPIVVRFEEGNTGKKSSRGRSRWCDRAAKARWPS